MEIDFITIVDYVGTFVFAISGVFAAVERKFDLFGVFILSLVTALGGGTLRDVLIGSTPVGWMLEPNYIFLIIIAIAFCYFFSTSVKNWNKGMILFDTLGIGLFTILGFQKTIESGLSPIIAILMGVVSAVFGGVLRDVLSNQVPLIFQKEVYAFACLSGALSYYYFSFILSTVYAGLLGILFVIIIRGLAIKYHWGVPYRPRA